VLLNFINSALESGKIPAAIFLDIKKEFDSLTHRILLGKLSHIGKRVSALTWFQSYLHERKISFSPDILPCFNIDFGVP